jgi:hypothetical protein
MRGRRQTRLDGRVSGAPDAGYRPSCCNLCKWAPVHTVCCGLVSRNQLIVNVGVARLVAFVLRRQGRCSQMGEHLA